MKIYLNQNDQKVGPYSREEARNLVYSGDVQRSALACYEGATDWVPLDSLLTQRDGAAAAAVPPPISLSLERLRDPKEKTALLWLYLMQQLASKVNVSEAALQWRQYRREFFVKYRTLYSTHPHHLARLDHLTNSAAELGIAA